MSTAKQQARLRRRILQLVDAAKSGGGMRGRMLADIMADLPEAPQDDSELMGLCQDLVNAGLLTVTDLRRRTGERLELDVQLYAVTDRGTALLAERIAPHPLVADDRLITPEFGN